MTWAAPWIGGIAAAIAIPSLIILYFLKLRRRDVEISTTLLWKKAIEDLQANAPFQRLRRNILLFLQLLVLAGVCAAVGQPQIKGDSAVGQRHVILIDRSASMSSRDATNDKGDTVTRLEAAKEKALKFIQTLKEPGLFDKDSGDQAMVITFDTSAKALQSFTSDKDVLKAAVEAIDASDAPSSLEEAFKLVLAQAPKEEIVETRDDGTQTRYARPPKPVGTIHLFSDGRLPDAAKVSIGKDNPILYEAIGSPEAANTGITSLRAGRAFDNPNKLSIFVQLQSTDRQARNVEVECRIDGVVAGIKTVDMPAAKVPGPGEGGGPGARAVPAVSGAVFNLDRPQGGIVTVHMTPPSGDTLGTDDTAWLVVPPAKKLAVAVVTKGNIFIADALASLPLSELRAMTPEEYEKARTSDKFNYDVVVLEGYLPQMPKEATSPLPPGRYLVLGAVPTGPGALVDKGVLETPSGFLDWSHDHPTLRNVALDAVNIARPRPVEIPKGSAAVTLATADTGPAILELSMGDSRSIIVTFNVTESDWPFQPSFVVFMAQAVGFLGDDSSGVGQMVQPGGVLSDRLPPDAREVSVRLPDNSPAEIGAPSADGTIVYGPLQRTGIYQVSWMGKPGPIDADLGGGRAARPFASNLLDPQESDVGTVAKLDLASQEVTAQQDKQTRVPKSLWPWLILGALAIILLEWFVYNRKVQL
jgi:hypothetical protein